MHALLKRAAILVLDISAPYDTFCSGTGGFCPAGIFSFLKLEIRMKRNPMTREGHRALQEELERLKKVERPQIIRAIEEARGHGDLSENAEYIYAKERQSIIEGRMQELEHKLGTAEIIDTTNLPEDRIVFGSRFVLYNVDTDEETVYQIVGVDESDISRGRISVESPMGKALISKKVDDEVIVETPGGRKEFEVVEILKNERS